MINIICILKLKGLDWKNVLEKKEEIDKKKYERLDFLDRAHTVSQLAGTQRSPDYCESRYFCVYKFSWIYENRQFCGY